MQESRKTCIGVFIVLIHGLSCLASRISWSCGQVLDSLLICDCNFCYTTECTEECVAYCGLGTTLGAFFFAQWPFLLVEYWHGLRGSIPAIPRTGPFLMLMMTSLPSLLLLYLTIRLRLGFGRPSCNLRKHLLSQSTPCQGLIILKVENRTTTLQNWRLWLIKF